MQDLKSHRLYVVFIPPVPKKRGREGDSIFFLLFQIYKLCGLTHCCFQVFNYLCTAFLFHIYINKYKIINSKPYYEHAKFSDWIINGKGNTHKRVLCHCFASYSKTIMSTIHTRSNTLVKSDLLTNITDAFFTAGKCGLWRRVV